MISKTFQPQFQVLIIWTQDEQMEEMNTLVEKNMELEAKLSLLVSDKKVSLEF